MKAILSNILVTTEADRIQEERIQERADYLAAVANSAGMMPRGEDADLGHASAVKRVAGSVLPIGYHPQNVLTKYIGEYTGEVLHPHLLQAAIMEELNYFNDRVWEAETIENVKEFPDRVHIRSRWVLCKQRE